MIRNYLKTAWRCLIKNKFYSTLNILGLAIGMAVALLIGLWVFNEYSYDKFLPNYKQLYQVELNFTTQQDGETTQTAVSLPLAEVLRKEIPGIKYVAETDVVGSQWHGLEVDHKKFYLAGGASHPDFFKIFQYQFLRGNANVALNDANSIVLTESSAKALFGNVDPIDKYVRIDNKQNVKITGIIKDIPKNSTLQFSFIIPFRFKEQNEGWVKVARTAWGNNSFRMFVELQAGTTYAQIASKIKDIVYQHNPYTRFAKPEVIFHPLKDWHLYNNFKNGKAVGGLADYVHLFGIIGLLVLFIACINFINLSTARSEKRAREVGVRKAIGSHRIDLIVQFLCESLLITFIASLFSILFVQLALPFFNTITGNAISIPYTNALFWITTILYVLAIGLLAGSRPAFYLSSFNPVIVLKGSIQTGRSAALPRKILVVLQFSCSVALIIGTIIVYKQILYAKNRSTGYSKDRLVSTDISGDLKNQYHALKNELLATGMVENVAVSSSPVTGIYSHTSLDKWPGKNAGEQPADIGAISVSDNYFQTLGVKLIEGHDFSDNWIADTTNVILNEAAVKRIGLKTPINQLISWDGNIRQVRIIGVVKDALMESPFTSVAPAIFAHSQKGNHIIYRLSRRVNTHDVIERFKKIFNRYYPDHPYNYHFVDEDYNHKFNLELLIGKLAGIFAGLAIFISCLGLFGLAAYVAEQRKKEVGIRKVLGATVAQLWLLLSKDFIGLVMVSCAIASPIAFYFLHSWLQKYDYRINISFGVFVFSAVIAIVITIMTISFQVVKAALANPVKSLKME